eukprot:scaffold29297_cov55-Attheya_sp.AAC.7
MLLNTMSGGASSSLKSYTPRGPSLHLWRETRMSCGGMLVIICSRVVPAAAVALLSEEWQKKEEPDEEEEERVQFDWWEVQG